jgi:hypothetical protein
MSAQRLMWLAVRYRAAFFVYRSDIMNAGYLSHIMSDFRKSNRSIRILSMSITEYYRLVDTGNIKDILDADTYEFLYKKLNNSPYLSLRVLQRICDRYHELRDSG